MPFVSLFINLYPNWDNPSKKMKNKNMKKIKIVDNEDKNSQNLVGEVLIDSDKELNNNNGSVFEIKDDTIFLNKGFWAQKVIERKFLIDKNVNIPPSDKHIEKVLLILESPHKDEFGDGFKPIAPAQGSTGTNIKNKIKCLLQQIEKCQNIGCNEKENLQNDYLITIYNPVPYQTSLNYILNAKEINKHVKEMVWRYAWFNKRCMLDFTGYLITQEYDIVINACTEDLQPYVSCAIHNAEKIKTEYSVYHPSAPYWNRKTPKFNLTKISHAHK